MPGGPKKPKPPRRAAPHDRLVRDVLSDPELAAGELRAVLPEALAARIEWGSLRLEPGHFADEEGESRTDLLFSAPLDGRRAYVYLLFEHQSRPEAHMPLRLLVYLTRIWRALATPDGEAGGASARLPVIIPLVLHHGERGWTSPRRLGELLDWDASTHALLAPFVPDFEVLVDDLAEVPEVELLQRDMAALGKVVVWVLRAVRVGFDPGLISEWAQELDRAQAPGREPALRHLLHYLLGTDEGTAIFEALERARLSEGVREVVMGLRQQWQREAHEQGRTEGRQQGRQEGRQQGRQEGRSEGQAELLLKQLRLRFGDLPAAVEPRVRAATSEELDRWAERVLSAERLDDVLD